jgi:CHAT domain
MIGWDIWGSDVDRLDDAHAVVLGVREAGRSRRSMADEPWGFPTLLLQQGAEAVVAPSWQVDDFAPFLLITFLFAVLDEDTPLERAEVSAAPVAPQAEGRADRATHQPAHGPAPRGRQGRASRNSARRRARPGATCQA